MLVVDQASSSAPRVQFSQFLSNCLLLWQNYVVRLLLRAFFFSLREPASTVDLKRPYAFCSEYLFWSLWLLERRTRWEKDMSTRSWKNYSRIVDRWNFRCARVLILKYGTGGYRLNAVLDSGLRYSVSFWLRHSFGTSARSQYHCLLLLWEVTSPVF